jgi:hypothetical protein
VLNWRDNIERELLLGDLMGKFNDVVHVEGITQSLKVSANHESPQMIELGKSPLSNHWRVNSNFTENNRIIGTFFRDQSCTNIHQVVYSMNRDVGIPLAELDSALFDENKLCYELFFKPEHAVDYLCPSIVLDQSFVSIFESLIDQRPVYDMVLKNLGTSS